MEPWIGGLCEVKGLLHVDTSASDEENAPGGLRGGHRSRALRGARGEVVMPSGREPGSRGQGTERPAAGCPRSTLSSPEVCGLGIRIFKLHYDVRQSLRTTVEDREPGSDREKERNRSNEKLPQEGWHSQQELTRGSGLQGSIWVRAACPGLEMSR